MENEAAVTQAKLQYMLDRQEVRSVSENAYGMLDIAFLARPIEPGDREYFRVNEQTKPTAVFDQLVETSSLIKQMAQENEYDELVNSINPSREYGFKKITEEREKHAERLPSDNTMPFTPFELALYRRLAQDIDFWWYESKITQNLTDAMNVDHKKAWKDMQLFGFDLLIPALSGMRNDQRQIVSDILEEDLPQSGETRSGSEIFCDALIRARVIQKDDAIDSAELWRKTIQLLPQLYDYYDDDIPDLEPQSHEYYMHMALALAYYSVLRGTDPFGAVIVDQHGFFLGATNEIDTETKQEDHAETVLMKKARKYWGPLIKNLTLYSTAEPCFGCAKEILHGNPVSRVFYGVPTTMGMEFFGISQAAHLKKLRCGMPDMKSGVLEQKIREFYRQNNFIDLIRPKINA